MRSTLARIRLASSALIIAFCAIGGSPAFAQTRAASLDELRRQLASGDFITITDEAGQRIEGRLIRFGQVDLDVLLAKQRTPPGSGSREVTIALDTIQTLQRPLDSTRNGTLIGAGIGAGVSGAMFGKESARRSRDRTGPRDRAHGDNLTQQTMTRVADDHDRPRADCVSVVDSQPAEAHQGGHMQRLIAPAVALMLCAAASPALAQDAVKVAPKTYTVVFENDQVRVLRATLNPGDKVPMHDHPNHVIVPLDTVTARFGLPDGKSVDAAMKTGEPIWSDATKHAPESTSKQTARVIIIELKGKGGAK